MGKKILIVEDDATISSMIASLLKAVGYRVVNAYTAEQSLNECRKDKPDIVLLDVVLPDVQGNELFCQFESMRVPMVLTSVLPREMVVRIMGSSEFQFLPKPYDLNRLLLAVATPDPRAGSVRPAPGGS